MRIIVTGGAGFIGSTLVRYLVGELGRTVRTVDKLSYSGSLANIRDVLSSPLHSFAQLDICDTKSMVAAFRDFEPDALFHLAAESHVDRSIDGPGEFIQTNVVGTFRLLEVSRSYWAERNSDFRFVHVSTDEVFGSLGHSGRFNEESPYRPSSPYSASKAASDHLALAWHNTYGLPVIVTRCSNNYGPFQFPEKLIPLVIMNAVNDHRIPIYGDGQNIRDWLFVEDHAKALVRILDEGSPGRSYNIGGDCEKSNIEVVAAILDSVADQLGKDRQGLGSLMEYVQDRPGHDRRYAIDPTVLASELQWHPETTFKKGIDSTVRWYLENQAWCDEVAERYDGQRLGLVDANNNQ